MYFASEEETDFDANDQTRMQNQALRIEYKLFV